MTHLQRTLWMTGGLILSLHCLNQEQSGVKPRVVLAEINGVPLYVDHFQKELNRLEILEDGQTPLASFKVLKQSLLKTLIEKQLMLNVAESHNVVISIDEVESTYQKFRQGWQDTEIDALLTKKDITAAEFKRELRDLLMIKKYLRDHVYARLAVTDADISEYIESYPESQLQPESVRALHIVVKTEGQAKTIAREIRMGLSFEDAAMKYSLSPEAKSGGDLGYFTRGSMPQIYEQVCFKLKPEAVSNVVTGDYGFHLFKVIDKRPEQIRPLIEVRDEIEKKLRLEKEREAHIKKIVELKAQAKIHIHDNELAKIH